MHTEGREYSGERSEGPIAAQAPCSLRVKSCAGKGVPRKIQGVRR